MKTLIIAFFILFPFFNLHSQVDIPEGGFDNWTLNETSAFEEPSGGWWTSLNSLVSLGSPVSVSKTTDAHSGSYAAKLESKIWGTFLIPGLLVSGKFEPYAPFVYRGKPFTDKPVRFKGYFKYFPAETDSAAIFAMLTKFNTSTMKRDTIAEAKMAVLTTVDNYTVFDIPFVYFVSDVTPDTIDVVFSSSAAGETFEGFAGSTLYVDDVSLDYESGASELLMADVKINVFPNPANSFLNITTDADCKKLSCSLYQINGSFVLMENLVNGSCSFKIDGTAPGKYILNVQCNGITVASEKIEIL